MRHVVRARRAWAQRMHTYCDADARTQVQERVVISMQCSFAACFIHVSRFIGSEARQWPGVWIDQSMANEDRPRHDALPNCSKTRAPYKAGTLSEAGNEHWLGNVSMDWELCMTHITGRRPKLVLFPTRRVLPAPGASEDDFHIYASYRGTSASGYYGTLKVVRKTDGRLLFPFDGADTIGPYPAKGEAIEAAQRRGDEVVRADLARPEL